jgi:formiminotetrahydrofolate cyclodeaminase
VTDGTPILDASLGDFLDAVAGASPAAAGGVGAIAAAAIAAGLVSMCARRSTETWGEASAIAGQAERLRGRAATLLTEAGPAYEGAVRSLDAADGSGDATPQSDWRLGEAVRGAARAPAQGAELGADVAELAAEAAAHCDPSCRPDALAACRLADAAARICTELVGINLVVGAEAQAPAEAVAAADRAAAALARAGHAI